MHSRRRFSSHPVDMRGQTLLGLPYFPPCSALTASSKAVSFGSTTSHSVPTENSQEHSAWCNAPDSGKVLTSMQPLCNRWRQSDPQMVTLPPFPVPLHELKGFLHRYKCALSQSVSPPLTSETANLRNNEPSKPTSANRLSRCSTVSVGNSSNSVTSCHHSGCCPHIEHPVPQIPTPVETHAELVHVSSSVGQKHLPSPTGSHNEGNGDTTQWPHQSSPLTFPSQFPFLNRSLSSGSSPQYSATPLLPTASLIPGSQHFHPRRKHTASASEAFASSPPTVPPSRQRAFSIMDQHNSIPLELPTCGRTSLVSLSSSSVPVWADAPVFAKPRTGHNYVSREAVIAAHAQRKRQQQQLNPHSPSAGPHSPPPSSSTLTHSSLSMQLVAATDPSATHPGNPASATRTCACHRDSVVCGEEADSMKASVIVQALPVSCCSSTNRFGHHTSNLSMTTVPPGDTPGITCQDNVGFLSRSYVNMGPPSGSSRLQPIAESQPLLSARTDPITRLQRRVDTLPPHISSLTNSHSATTLSSYVNVPTLLTQSAGQPYVNLPPSSSTVGTSSNRGLHSIPSNMEQCGVTQNIVRPSSTMIDRLASSTSLFATSVSQVTNEQAVPRLHYALLTLSTVNSDPSPSTSCNPGSSAAQCTCVCSAVPVNTTALLESLQSVHSAPRIGSPSVSSPAGTTLETALDEISSGLNYVTIDLTQTKALSELEQELRSSTTFSTTVTSSTLSSHNPGRSWRFRHTVRRGLTSSAIPSTDAVSTERISSRTRYTNVTFTHPGSSTNSKRSPVGSATLSLPARVFTRLTNSIHMHTNFNRKSSTRRHQTSLPRSASNMVSPPYNSGSATSGLGV